MKAYVAVTDNDWYQFLSQRPDRDEVNFWQPGGKQLFRALKPGELFLFKLHSPNNVIAGGGLFAHSTLLPVSMAWEAFGEKNGAATLLEMRRQIEHYRRSRSDPHQDYTIGCIVLEEPFFFDKANRIPVPEDFPSNIPGKGYDLQTEPGSSLLKQLEWALRSQGKDKVFMHEKPPMYGKPITVLPRLGQGSFRVLVTDIYQRRCAVTGEKALPVIEAAHIQPVSQGGIHRIDNGLLLRSDVHTLFDRGYVTVTPDHRFNVSRRLKDDFDNGEHYYQFKGKQIWLPPRTEDRPNREFLEWHADAVFLG
ncbi:MAG: HNH endonuclease [Nitrospiraceae bacterium]|nr:MAG: HNH endonuclease [Nitrospiraceae bacterium]